MTRPAACLILIMVLQILLGVFCLMSFPAKTQELTAVQVVTVLVCFFTLIAPGFALP